MSKKAQVFYLDGTLGSISYAAKALNSGADGYIYASLDKKYALKIYHDPAKDPKRQEKIWQMIKHAPQADGFAWPEAMLGNSQGEFIGFLMPLLDLNAHVQLEFLLSKRARQTHGITESYDFRVKVAANLAKRIADLHALGHHIIDLKPVNLSFDKNTADVAIVDCDGFSIKGDKCQYYGHQYTSGYISPEAFNCKLGPEKLAVGQDMYAMAVILLLNNGLHPFQGVPVAGANLPSDNQAKAAAGLYAYGPKGHASILPSPWSLHLGFTDELSQALQRCLTSRVRHSAKQWQTLLEDSAAKLTNCQQDKHHQYWGGSCPHCQLGKVKIR